MILKHRWLVKICRAMDMSSIRWSVWGLVGLMFGCDMPGSDVYAAERYKISYELRQGSKSVSSSKTVTAESEQTAIAIVKDIAESERPGYDFVLKGSGVQNAPKKTSYMIRYELRQGSHRVSGSRTVTAETERAAIEIAKSMVESERPGYTFILKAVTKQALTR
jgi:hypothetical protein